MLLGNHAPAQNRCPFSVFNLAFRIFFLAATSFSALAMLLWFVTIQQPDFYQQWLKPAPNLPSLYWHAHEMLFGFAIVLIAGFTLTAVKNWTHIQTPYGARLCLLFSTWLIARLGYLFPGIPFAVTAFFDILFGLWLTYEFARPVLKAKQWKQISLVSKVALIAFFNSLFYLGIFGYLEQGVQWGVMGGLLIAISLIITMGRRIISFFIEKGVDGDFTAKNPVWIDRWGLGIYLIFTTFAVFFPSHILTPVSAGLLFLLHLIRLQGWYTPLIWAKPLLWSLWLGYAVLTFGFLLYALTYFFPAWLTFAIHAFALGGFGLIGLGMMARVSLGHTGRNVFDPPKIISLIYLLITLAVMARIILPMLLPSLYLSWMMLAQLSWIVGFLIFVITYAKMLTTPRVDGHWG